MSELVTPELLAQARADLESLARIPSVSVDPAHAGDVRRSAEAVAELFRSVGVEDARVVESGGSRPAVLGHIPAPPGAPTVLLYAHHDVQPVGDISEWATDPFEPTEVDGRLYGRGTADDKAGVIVHVTSLRAHGGRPPVGICLLIEGEEEVGSPTLADFVAGHRAELAADVVLVPDAINPASGLPSLTTSLRGLVDCVVEVRTGEYGVHSGLWGGLVPDAVTALVKLLATLHDEQGSVAVEGLLRGQDPTYELDEAKARQESAIVEGGSFIGTGSMAGRLWQQPAISIIGFDAPAVAQAGNVLVPVARAVVSLRIAPDQAPALAMAALTSHLEKHVPWGAQLTVTPRSSGSGWQAPSGRPAQRAMERALAEAYGVDSVQIGVGGSIPIVAGLAGAFPEAESLITGIEDPHTRAHSTNESLLIKDFEAMCHAQAQFFTYLAEHAG